MLSIWESTWVLKNKQSASKSKKNLGLRSTKLKINRVKKGPKYNTSKKINQISTSPSAIARPFTPQRSRIKTKTWPVSIAIWYRLFQLQIWSAPLHTWNAIPLQTILLISNIISIASNTSNETKVWFLH